jgi:DNA topoisomerase-6 subunit B
VSVVSTKIPFKGTGKEYIGDDISEIATAVKVGIFLFSCISREKKRKRSSKLTAAFLQSAIQQCCIQLKSKIMKKMQAREQQERKRNLNR